MLPFPHCGGLRRAHSYTSSLRPQDLRGAGAYHCRPSGVHHRTFGLRGGEAAAGGAWAQRDDGHPRVGALEIPLPRRSRRQRSRACLLRSEGVTAVPPLRDSGEPNTEGLSTKDMYACIHESGAGFFDGGRRENPPITFRNPPWLTIQRIDSPRTPVAASAFPSLQWKVLDIRAGVCQQCVSRRLSAQFIPCIGVLQADAGYSFSLPRVGPYSERDWA